jgi:ubiquinone/menaquinone biosynthesis C-methylase UbiE
MNNEHIYLDGGYLQKNHSWHVEDSPWKASEILKILRKNNINADTICEVGCGAGEILYQLSKSLLETQFYGYEISPQAFKLTSSRKNERIHFYLKDFFEEEVFFNVVMAIDVIEHVEDYYSFLRALKKKGEYKIFHIPLDLSVQTVLRSTPILAGRKQVGHIHYFTKETALATLRDSGYEILDYFYTAAMIEKPEKSLRTRILNIPRRLMFQLNKNITARILGGYSLLVLTK